jgi:hypothetical protein
LGQMLGAAPKAGTYAAAAWNAAACVWYAAQRQALGTFRQGTGKPCMCP